MACYRRRVSPSRKTLKPELTKGLRSDTVWLDKRALRRMLAKYDFSQDVFSRSPLAEPVMPYS